MSKNCRAVENFGECIQHSPDARFLIVREDYAAIVGQDMCQAVLIQVFGRWHEYQWGELVKWWKKKGKDEKDLLANWTPELEDKLLQRHSYEGLVTEILGLFSRCSVIKAVNALCELGVLERREPTAKDPRRARVSYYLFHPHVVNELLAKRDLWKSEPSKTDPEVSSEIRLSDETQPLESSEKVQTIVEKQTKHRLKVDEAPSKSRRTNIQSTIQSALQEATDQGATTTTKTSTSTSECLRPASSFLVAEGKGELRVTLEGWQGDIEKLLGSVSADLIEKYKVKPNTARAVLAFVLNEQLSHWIKEKRITPQRTYQAVHKWLRTRYSDALLYNADLLYSELCFTLALSSTRTFSPSENRKLPGLILDVFSSLKKLGGFTDNLTSYQEYLTNVLGRPAGISDLLNKGNAERFVCMVQKQCSTK
jgi:hypothetical protein